MSNWKTWISANVFCGSLCFPGVGISMERDDCVMGWAIRKVCDGAQLAHMHFVTPFSTSQRWWRRRSTSKYVFSNRQGPCIKPMKLNTYRLTTFYSSKISTSTFIIKNGLPVSSLFHLGRSSCNVYEIQSYSRWYWYKRMSSTQCCWWVVYFLRSCLRFGKKGRFCILRGFISRFTVGCQIFVLSVLQARKWSLERNNPKLTSKLNMIPNRNWSK